MAIPPPKVTPTSLREWRENAHLTQEEAAALLGVTVGTYRNWEQGRAAPTGATQRFLQLMLVGVAAGTVYQVLDLLEEWGRSARRA